MPTIQKDAGNALSKEDLKAAVKNEKLQPAKATELSEAAQSVAQNFAEGTVSPAMLVKALALTDMLVIAAIGMFTSIMAMHMVAMPSLSTSAAAVGTAILTASFCKALDGYLVPTLKSFVTSSSRVIIALLLSVIVVTMLQFVMSGFANLQSAWVYQVFAAGVGYFAINRFFVTRFVKTLAETGRLSRRAVIVGGGEPAAELIRSLESNPDTDIQICGIFDDRKDARSPDIVGGYPKLGTVSELLAFARTARINMMIVSLPLTAEKRVLQLMKRLWVLPVDIRLSAHTNKTQFRPRSYSYEGTVPMVDVIERPIANWDAVAKRTLDIVGAATAIVLLSPVMLAAAIAVRLDSKGPVIFKQKREGFNNEEIEIYKFRSLYTDMGDKTGVNVVTKGDSRVTRVGRFIRKTSIDELPQLFNVLQGSLSLVGPRPHVANAQTNNQLWAEVVDSYIARHKVKPGVTGWAQITGWRGEVDTEAKLEGRVNADLYYIENWSLMFDLYILALTPFRLMNTEKAY